jgi:hypothetical protein
MTCEQFLNALQNRLDHSHDDSPEASLHVADCSVCRSWQAAADQLEAGVPLFRTTISSPMLTERIVAQVMAERKRRIRRERMRWTVGALAASVALAFMTSAIVPRLVSKQKNQLIDTSASVKAASQGMELPAKSSAPDRMSEASMAVASLSAMAKEQTLKQTQLFMPVATAPLPFDKLTVPQAFDGSTESLREAGKGVSEGLKPVTDSARRAWDLLLREIPPIDASGKTNS